ncbi:hypothetical protein XANCAGTX0491_009652 [Xanthoria calcicola]
MNFTPRSPRNHPQVSTYQSIVMIVEVGSKGTPPPTSLKRKRSSSEYNSPAQKLKLIEKPHIASLVLF